ncbi:hypothetical protein ACFOJ6_03945 [Gordonia humi]|uniref:hypothetical protein n=1 Tax=Gordonia humi TaxID=686429 RepID=UPI00360C20A0
MSAGLLTAGPAVAEPTKSNPIASLINRIADVDQTLTDLSDAVAAKQEHVNKALVDFQNAMAARQLAVSANAGAKKSLTAVGAEVERAQREFDDFVRTVFRQGGQPRRDDRVRRLRRSVHGPREAVGRRPRDGAAAARGAQAPGGP